MGARPAPPLPSQQRSVPRGAVGPSLHAAVCAPCSTAPPPGLHLAPPLAPRPNLAQPMARAAALPGAGPHGCVSAAALAVDQWHVQHLSMQHLPPHSLWAQQQQYQPQHAAALANSSAPPRVVRNTDAAAAAAQQQQQHYNPSWHYYQQPVRPVPRPVQPQYLPLGPPLNLPQPPAPQQPPLRPHAPLALLHLAPGLAPPALAPVPAPAPAVGSAEAAALTPAAGAVVRVQRMILPAAYATASGDRRIVTTGTPR